MIDYDIAALPRKQVLDTFRIGPQDCSCKDYNDFQKTSQGECKHALKQKTLFHIIGDPGKMDGQVFLTDTATDSFYFMLAYMESKTAPDPDFMQEYDENLQPAKSPEILPMVEVFQKYLRKILNAALATNPGKPIYDYVLHRAAFLLMTQNVLETSCLWHDPESLVKIANSAKGVKTSLGGGMACELKKAYLELELGWDDAVLRNEDTYAAELDIVRYKREILGETNAKPRSCFFLSHNRLRKPSAGQVVGSLYNSPLPAAPVGLPAELPAMNDAEKNLLTCIAEKLGEERYSTWFGNHSICKLEESEKQVVFSVRNNFVRNGIRRHCNREVEEVITEQMPAGVPAKGGA